MLRCHVCGAEIKVLLGGTKLYSCNCREREQFGRMLNLRIDRKRIEVATVELMNEIGNPIHWPCGKADCLLCAR